MSCAKQVANMLVLNFVPLQDISLGNQLFHGSVQTLAG